MWNEDDRSPSSCEAVRLLLVISIAVGLSISGVLGSVECSSEVVPDCDLPRFFFLICRSRDSDRLSPPHFFSSAENSWSSTPVIMSGSAVGIWCGRSIDTSLSSLAWSDDAFLEGRLAPKSRSYSAGRARCRLLF